MSYKPTDFWKNINLNAELHISGAFLYDALLSLDRMNHFCYEDECFSFLYNVSVGIERLEKIAIILLEHDDKRDQEEFEKSLITHNHLDLIKRIQKSTSIDLDKGHNKFLQLLSNFYKSYRYDRYNLSSVYEIDKEKIELVAFVSQELKLEINAGMMFPSSIDIRIRRFIGKIVTKIVKQLYEIIRSAKTFTYELRYDSKASKIFLAGENEYDFVDKRICQKEVLIHLMNNQDTNYGFMDLIKQIKPLELDSAVNNEYVKFLFDITDDTYGVVDEIKQIYEDNKFDKERFELISLIGEDSVIFDTNDDMDIYEDDDTPI
jgi:hypothetical protein